MAMGVSRWLAVGVVVLAAVALRTAGLDWRRLHHDERKIAGWLSYTEDHRFIEERVYAEGFFALMRPVRWVALQHARAGRAVDRWLGRLVPEDEPLDYLLLARGANAAFGALTVLLIMALAYRVTGRFSAALLAGAGLALHPYAIEHAHYAETDVAACLAVTAALWAMAAALDSGRRLTAWVAAAAAGFAAGTKFPLALLVLPLAATTACVGRRQAGRRAAVVLAVGAAAAFAAVFVAANPGFLHPRWLIPMARRGLWQVLHEDPPAPLSGPDAGPPDWQLQARDLADGMSGGVWPWLALAVVGMGFALARSRHRRYWPVLVLFPVVYVVYGIGLAPWIRSQEGLLAVPAVLVLASLPLLWVWERATRGVRLAGAGVALLLLGLTAFRGLGIANVFATPDTRTLAQDWLETHAPRERGLAAELYTNPMFGEEYPPVFKHTVDVYKIERVGLAYARERGADYFLCNRSTAGRGLTVPGSQRLRREFQDEWDAFLGATALLRQWRLYPPDLGTFAGHDLRLYGLRPAAGQAVPDAVLPQPVTLPANGRETFFPAGAALGSTAGIVTGGAARRLWVAAGGQPRRPLYGVLCSGESPLTATLKGFGARRRLRLEARDVRVVALGPRRGVLGAWRKREPLVLRVRGAGSGAPPWCLLRVVGTPAEAAQLCRVLGRPQRALGLEHAAGADAAAAAEVYQAAVACGDRERAARLRPAAAAWGAQLAAAGAAVQARGAAASHYDDFARIRLSSCEFRADPRRVLELPRRVAVAADGRAASVELPVRVAEGRYEIRGEFLAVIRDGRLPEGGRLEIAAGASGEPAQIAVDRQTVDAWQPFTAVADVTAETALCLRVAGLWNGLAEFRNLEVRWTMVERIQRSMNGLRRALDDDAGAGERSAAGPTDRKEVAGGGGV